MCDDIARSGPPVAGHHHAIGVADRKDGRPLRDLNSRLADRDAPLGGETALVEKREVEKLQIGELDPHTDRGLIQFSYYLLTENPFVNIFIDE